jgi:4'-phosphopantetheinyl transferase
MPALRAADVDLWTFNLAALEGAITRRALAALSAQERDRFSRLVSPESARLTCLRRGVLRLLLASYTGRPAPELAIDSAALEKPVIATGPPFGVSNNGTWAAIAIGSDDACLGVDVEGTIDPKRADHLARRAFSAEERAELAALDDPLRAAAILRLWTCKEAWAKALGQGLHADLTGVTLAPAGPGLVAETAPDRPERLWRVWTSHEACPDATLTIIAEGDRPGLQPRSFGADDLAALDTA